MTLTENQRDRYRRNIDIPGLGEAGQSKLLTARVLVVGAGGLGSAALPYLAAAGVGQITVADGDVVEEMNLQRQVLHSEIGENKATSAAARLTALNPNIEIIAISEMLDAKSAPKLMAEHDIVVDCCDSFGAKYLLSDAAQATATPLVWAAAVSMQGQCSVFGVPTSSGNPLWLRDLFPVEPDPELYPLAKNVGVLGAMVGQLGALEACETIKLITGLGEPLVGRVMILDAAAGRWDVVEVENA